MEQPATPLQKPPSRATHGTLPTVHSSCRPGRGPRCSPRRASANDRRCSHAGTCYVLPGRRSSRGGDPLYTARDVGPPPSPLDPSHQAAPGLLRRRAHHWLGPGVAPSLRRADGPPPERSGTTRPGRRRLVRRGLRCCVGRVRRCALDRLLRARRTGRGPPACSRRRRPARAGLATGHCSHYHYDWPERTCQTHPACHDGGSSWLRQGFGVAGVTGSRGARCRVSGPARGGGQPVASWRWASSEPVARRARRSPSTS
jgi:hypothetical protein